jgi:hypothetical protein
LETAQTTALHHRLVAQLETVKKLNLLEESQTVHLELEKLLALVTTDQKDSAMTAMVERRVVAAVVMACSSEQAA